MAKVANGDTSAIRALYAHSDDATSFYGWGGYEKGWDEVSKRWDWAGSSSRAAPSATRRDDRGGGRARLHHRYRDFPGAHGRTWTSPPNGPTGSRTSSVSRTASGVCCIATPTAWKTSSSHRRACGRFPGPTARAGERAELRSLETDACGPDCRNPFLDPRPRRGRAAHRGRMRSHRARRRRAPRAATWWAARSASPRFWRQAGRRWRAACLLARRSRSTPRPRCPSAQLAQRRHIRQLRKPLP